MNDKILLRIKEIVKETPDAITIHFVQPEEPLHYLAGQFLTLICDIDGKEERRSYSLCSSPDVDQTLSVTVKRVRGGKMSNYLNEFIRVDDEILILPPMGNFKFYPEDISRHLVLIGGGSGITPLFSIIKSALIKESSSKVSLIYVNSSREETIFYEELEQMVSRFSFRFRIIHYWSEEIKNEKIKGGFFSRLFKKKNSHRINSVRLKEIFDGVQIEKWKKTEFYLCGPQGLMETAATAIQEIGFSDTVIHKESFYALSKTENIPRKQNQERQIKILLKGQEHQIKVSAGTSILFAGLDAGLDMPYSCQSGSCVSCAGKCLSGTVEMLTSDGLTEQQINDGYVLTCVGYPQSDDVIIEFLKP